MDKIAKSTGEFERTRFVARFAKDKVFEVAIRQRIGKRREKTVEVILSSKRERIATTENRAELVRECEESGN